MANTYLKESILFLVFEPVRAEDFITALRLFLGETLIVALEELEDILNDDRLKVNLFLVVEVLCAKLNLGHVDIRV